MGQEGKAVSSFKLGYGEWRALLCTVHPFLFLIESSSTDSASSVFCMLWILLGRLLSSSSCDLRAVFSYVCVMVHVHIHVHVATRTMS